MVWIMLRRWPAACRLNSSSVACVVALQALVAACGGVSHRRSDAGPRGEGGAGPQPLTTAAGAAGYQGLCPRTIALPAGAQPCALEDRECEDAGLMCVDPGGEYTPVILPPGRFDDGCPMEIGSVPCEADADCVGSAGSGSVPRSDPAPALLCIQHGECESYCDPACSCNPDEDCDSSGHCISPSCVDGYACGTDSVCAPERPWAFGAHYGDSDNHGCSPASCVSDGYHCADGFTCDPTAGDVHGCAALPCDAGGFCQLDERCDPTSTTYNHCVRLACESDHDCDCGSCFKGLCRRQLGYCTPGIL
jgi:hypothetical protein